MVLTQRIFGLSLKFLLNHRGSNMNLRFQSIYRILTRKFLSIITKIAETTVSKAALHKKNTKNDG